MAHKFKLDFDGQSVVQDDYNGLATEASTGEDHVYAELFRLTPGVGSIARGVIPYGTAATIVANGASGSVLVNPFRAVIGTRTAAATDAVLNYQDVRSSLSIADGATALTNLVSLAANASGNPRWDMIYAAVTIDSASTPTTRKVKNPGTGVVTDESVSVYSRTSVAIGTVAGTPGASPAFPTIPADAGSVYYVLLGYVRVPTGFTAGSTVNNKDINEAFSALTISATTGAGSCRPASSVSVPGGAGIIGAGTSTANGILAWNGTTNTRPGAFIPPSMVGFESLLVALDLGNASSANWSHQHGAVVDSSRDWRNRLWRWMAAIGSGANTDTGGFPWGSSLTGSLLSAPSIGGGAAPMPGFAASAFYPTIASGMGSSNFSATVASVAQLSATGAAAQTTPAANANVPTNVMATGTNIYLYADTSTGNLKVAILGVPLVSVFFWLDASAQFGNT